MAAIEKFARIFGTIVPAFFIREKPTSRKRKPTCMNMTSTAATTTQVVSIAGMASLSVGSMTRIVSQEPESVMRPAYRIRRGGFVPVAKNSIAAPRAGPRLARLLAERDDAGLDAV